MARPADPRVKLAFWYVTEDGYTPSKACRLAGIARTSLYRYAPFIKHLKAKNK